MCTILAAVGQDPEYPLIVAANRDELLDRPASGLQRWPGAIPFIAPRDERALGTWVGLNRAGLFVAVTNRYLSSRNPERRSRGQLVVDALQAPDATSLHERLHKTRADTYNAFHLFYADRARAFVTWTDDVGIFHEELGPGVHVLTERSFAKEPASRAERLKRMWAELGDHREPERLFSLLRVHSDDDPFAATCIHAPAFNYGTRSSTLLYLAPSLARSRLLDSDGPSCQAVLRERSTELAALQAG